MGECWGKTSCTVEVGDAVTKVSSLDFLKMEAGGGVIKAGNMGQVAWLSVVVGEEVRAAVTVVKILVNEAGVRGSTVGAADVSVLAVVVFAMGLGQI